MRNLTEERLLFLLFALFLIHGYAAADNRTKLLKGQTPVFVSQQGDKPDIDWFKDEMGISSKYTEHESGVMGLSWAHFLTMVFLMLSFVAAVIALVLRYRRTKELLALILKEGSQDDGKG